MATVDSARCRLRLTESELANPPALRTDPNLPPWAGELLDVLARPGLRIVVRIFTAERPDDDPLLLLVPSGVREIWAALTGLLPDRRPATERNTVWSWERPADTRSTWTC